MNWNQETYLKLKEASSGAFKEYEAACLKYERDPQVLELRAFENSVKLFCLSFQDFFSEAYGYETLLSFNFKDGRLHWVLERADRHRCMSVPEQCLGLTHSAIITHDDSIRKELGNLKKLYNTKTCGKSGISTTNLRNDIERLKSIMWLHIETRCL